MLRYLAVPALFAALTTVAVGQTIVINPTGVAAMPPSAVRTAPVQPTRISLSINTFVPTPAAGIEQSLKAQEDGRKLVYQSAAHECDVLRETIARDCQLESININVQHVSANQNFNGGKVDGYNINGSINFQITPKGPADQTTKAPTDQTTTESGEVTR